MYTSVVVAARESEAFIFAASRGGYGFEQLSKRVLHKLAVELELPKLTFQVLRRTIATLAQKKGTVKDVQGYSGRRWVWTLLLPRNKIPNQLLGDRDGGEASARLPQGRILPL
jgi:hypothetical protein